MIFRHQVVHVGLGLCEFHLVHTLACVPMKEGLTPEHRGELLGDTAEDLLDGGRVADECGGHAETAGRDVTHCYLHIVRDPLDEVTAT